jgi:proline iminopeptidase
MKRLAAFLFLLSISVSQGARECAAQQQQPREGYVRTADGVRLFYRVVGDGPETLVAVHGGPGNTLESILADLEPLAKGRRVIYYDQRGGGRSDLIRERDKLAVSKHVADLEAVRSFFKLERMTLLGNSWGGVLVAYYAAAHPDRVGRLILHSPGEPTRAFAVEAVEEMQSRIDQHYTPAERKRYGFVSDPRNWVKAEDPLAICREFYALLLPIYVSKPESMKSFKGDVCAGPVEAVRYQQVVNVHVMNSLGDWNLLPSLGVVKAPVLVIHGEADPIPVESSEAWARAFPNAELLLVEGAGHLPQVERPEVFFDAVETFLKGGRVRGARRVRGAVEK